MGSKSFEQFNWTYTLKLLALLSVLLIQTAWAARNAVVVSEKAVIWADISRTTPLGYAARGKVLRVGEIQRDKNQVLPVLISGKIAYISVEDITFSSDERKRAIESAQESRFVKNIDAKSQVSKRFSIGATQAFTTNKDSYLFDSDERFKDFTGLQFRGDLADRDARIRFGFVSEFRQSSTSTGSLRSMSFGLGVSWVYINTAKLKTRLETFVWAIPYANLKEGRLFSLNGFGGGALAQAGLDLIISREWGVEVNAGVEAQKFVGFKIPEPFKSFSPNFIGTRVGLSLVRHF
jgi:hypothetical protein